MSRTKNVNVYNQIRVRTSQRQKFRDRPPLRSWKPPVEFTPEKDRAKNGPCTWHKKGKCDWKEYCNLDHSAAAMATLPTPGRPTSRSVCSTSVVSTKNEEKEKDRLIEAMLQRLEILEGKLPLMFRVTFPTAGARDSTGIHLSKQ